MIPIKDTSLLIERIRIISTAGQPVHHITNFIDSFLAGV